MGIDDRKMRVLEAIVKDYIATAEPVGSRTIARKYSLGVSPATIRNEMADLEEMGLIEQPHTSAGRIPSDKGYRLFVDCLMQKQSPSSQEEDLVLKQIHKRRLEIEDMLLETSRMLSRLSSYASLASVPGSSMSAIEQVQVINIAPQKAVVVVVNKNGLVQHSVLEVPEWMDGGDMQHIAAMINRHLVGMNPGGMTKTVLEGIFRELNLYRDLLDQILELLSTGVGPEAADKVYLGGTLNILNQPEFREVSRLKSLLGFLEDDSFVRTLITKSDSDRGLTIKIGGENRITELQDCSLVTATYELDGKVIGTIGLLGPTRMDYARAVGLLEFMSGVLSEYLRKFYTG